MTHPNAECSLPFEHVGPCEVRGTGGFVEWDDVKDLEPWSRVGSGLWVGGSLMKQPRAEDFDLVVTMSRRAQPCGPELHEVTAFIPDTVVERPDLVNGLAHFIDMKAKRGGGYRVLIRCQLGLNRSALIAALVLMNRGWVAEEAIADIRRLRSPLALCNPEFVRYLLEWERSMAT